MAGVTDAPFRYLARKYGADMAVSEMIASQAMVRNVGKSLRMSDTLADKPETPLAVQIAGGDPEVLSEAARMNVERGAEIIDINMGCPVKKIVKGQAGAALLRDEALVARIIRAVVAAVAVPVTVKIRLGWDDETRNALRIAAIAQEEGARLLTVHGRTRAQMYRGSADWDAIAQVKASTALPVVGNGDITDAEDAAAKWRASGVDALMIGRGAMGRPWLFRQIDELLRYGKQPQEPGVAERYAIAREHLQLLLDFHGAVSGNRLARKHLAWYTRGLRGGAAFRDAVNHSEDPLGTLQLLDDFFAPLLEAQTV
ncbi:putative nifR3 family TIM-barrel protein [Magnetofaba australis IT-1]|uniref:tRNA-dihydrouridine synthase n=2 Tax=Magnetofaba TaxID=1472292 RepID=A0A1Y2K7K3_9PROT|nr:putative nifR3 family TIM-barrel protein [Magnetofaba australis IT-1]